MKRLIFGSILTLSLLAFEAQAGKIVLEGHYQGKNIFVKNSFGGSGVGFCVFEVSVNGQISTDEVNQSAFEIDFNNFNLKIGDPVIVNIAHKDDCGHTVEVLNPEVLKPKSTFKTEKIAVSSDGVLKWTTSNETGKIDYIVEQYRWNKWVKVGEVSGEGVPGTHNYTFKISPHSGENRFRVKQTDYSGRPRVSPSADYMAKVPEISIPSLKIKLKEGIQFSGGETMYELYDKYGTIVKRGFGSSADVATLQKGTYYLSYDNRTETVEIR